MMLWTNGIAALEPKCQSLMIRQPVLMTGKCRGTGPMAPQCKTAGKQTLAVVAVHVLQEARLGHPVLVRMKLIHLVLLVLKELVALLQT